jgi:HSP20 family protein
VWACEPAEMNMAIAYADPFDALLSLQKAVEQRYESDWLEDTTAGVGAFPPINVFQQGDDFIAVVEMPGVGKDDLTLEAKANTIRIAGKKSVDYGAKSSAHRCERVSGTFDRAITVPIELDPDRIVAEFRDGVMVIFLPRSESDKPKSIRVT